MAEPIYSVTSWGTAKAIFSYRPGCAAASRDIRHRMRLTFGLLPLGCVETGSPFVHRILRILL